MTERFNIELREVSSVGLDGMMTYQFDNAPNLTPLYIWLKYNIRLGDNFYLRLVEVKNHIQRYSIFYRGAEIGDISFIYSKFFDHYHGCLYFNILTALEAGVELPYSTHSLIVENCIQPHYEENVNSRWEYEKEYAARAMAAFKKLDIFTQVCYADLFKDEDAPTYVVRDFLSV